MVDFELGFLIASLIAGMLTVLAPCVLPLLPVIIGGSTTGKGLKKPLTIIISLSISIIVFSLLLKASTALIDIPDSFWKWLSGGILLIFGVLTLFPDAWLKISHVLKVEGGSNKLLGRGMKKGGFAGDAIVGAALGPVFSSCSPVYATVVAVALPASYFIGLIYLFTYVIGLAIPLMAIALGGQKLSSKLGVLSNPKGWFKRIIAVLFIVVGLFIITGTDKKIESWLIDRGFYNGIIKLEQNLTE